MTAKKMVTYYDVLGVAPTATDEEIRQAYRKQARRWHPDVPGGDEVRMKDINTAHASLSTRRGEYDRWVAAKDADPGLPPEQTAPLATSQPAEHYVARLVPEWLTLLHAMWYLLPAGLALLHMNWEYLVLYLLSPLIRWGWGLLVTTLGYDL